MTSQNYQHKVTKYQADDTHNQSTIFFNSNSIVIAS